MVRCSLLWFPGLRYARKLASLRSGLENEFKKSKKERTVFSRIIGNNKRGIRTVSAEVYLPNRLEFKNAGYSLKPFEELGQPGSKQRNPIIAAVFHELHFAETKGTGIGSIKKWMSDAGLTTPPIIETDRDRNEFDLVLLPHHLLDQHDLEWLVRFKGYKLTDPKRRTLVFVREIGVITNQDYRQINGTDTLAASRALTHLRDMGLLNMKGSGNGSYYILGEPSPIREKPIDALTPQTTNLSGGGSPPIPANCYPSNLSSESPISNSAPRKKKLRV